MPTASSSLPIIALLALLLLLPACASLRDGELPKRPAGFTLAARIYAPEEQPRDAPRALRPARYVVETDRTYRVATGQTLARPWGSFPSQVRRLSPWQMDDLWIRVKEAGLADRAHHGTVTGPPPSPEPDRHSTAVFEITRNYRPIIIVVVLDEASPEALAAAELIDHLAELAWIAE